jgi:hypothetical protein
LEDSSMQKSDIDPTSSEVYEDLYNLFLIIISIELLKRSQGIWWDPSARSKSGSWPTELIPSLEYALSEK